MLELFAGLYRLFFGTSSEANAEGSYAPSAVGLEEKTPMVRLRVCSGMRSNGETC